MTTIKREEFLKEVTIAYLAWQAILNLVSVAEMDQPMQPQGWSVKDVIAHITWHEREMINLIRQMALIGSALWQRPLDERNAAIYDLYKDKAFDEVLAEAEETHIELIPLLESLTDEQLNDSSHFAEMPPEWLPWDLIAGNTFRHYRDHTDDLRNWLKGD